MQKFEFLKEKHPNTLVLQMQGNFYKAFNESAFVLSGLMNYKLKKTKSGYKCGFPVVAYEKVKAMCEEQKISYVFYDGNVLVSQCDFSNEHFQEYCVMYGQEIQEEKIIKAEKKPENCQALILVEGCGINVSEALGNLKDNIIKEILSKGFRIVSLSLLEKDVNSEKIVFIQGIIVYEFIVYE